MTHRAALILTALCVSALCGCVLDWDRTWPVDATHDSAAHDSAAPDSAPPDSASTDPPGHWAVALGAQDHASPTEVVLDNAGNIYIGGAFKTALPGSGTSLTTKGNFDLFVAKLSSQGKVLWVITGGGAGNDTVHAVSLDPGGGVLVGGYFQKSMTLGGKTYPGTKQDAFVARIKSGSSVDWVRTFGGVDTTGLADMVVDEANDVIWITGKVWGKVKLGSDEFTSKNLDTYVARLSAKSGVAQKALLIQGSQAEVPAALALVPGGGVVVTGSFGGAKGFTGVYTLDIGGTQLTCQGELDVYVTRINANADKVLWATSVGSAGIDESRDVLVDAKGNIYLSGFHGGAMTVGSTKLTFGGVYDLFVAKLWPGGGFSWAISSTGSSVAEGSRLASFSKDQLLLAGHYKGADTLGGKQLANRGNRDVLLARLATSDGGVKAIATAGGASLDHPLGLAVDSQGMTHITGLIQGSATFGKTTLKPKGFQDVFVWRRSAP